MLATGQVGRSVRLIGDAREHRFLFILFYFWVFCSSLSVGAWEIYNVGEWYGGGLCLIAWGGVGA